MFHSNLRRGVFAATVVGLIAFGAVDVLVSAQEKKITTQPGAEVFVYPEKLTAKDKLSFGEKGERIEIKGDTTLVWVDLAPGARYGHPTECVLISAEGTKVVKGDWWLVLNGKSLFRDGKPYKAEMPLKLSGK